MKVGGGATWEVSMCQPQERFKERLNFIIDEIIFTSTCWEIHKQLSGYYANDIKIFKMSNVFLQMIGFCIFRTILISVCNLFTKSSREFSLDHLVNYAESNANIFSYKRGDIPSLVEGHKNAIKEKNSVVRRLKLIRDKKIAHLDREALTSPEMFKDVSIYKNDFESLIGIAKGIVNDYSVYLDDTELRFEVINWDDFEVMVKYALEGQKQARARYRN